VNKKAELFVSIITLVSVIVILIPSIYPLTSTELDIIYIFDTVVVAILAVDFYIRLRESGQGSRFILTHFYKPYSVSFFAYRRKNYCIHLKTNRSNVNTKSVN
jgi:hypothetical protein